MNYKIQEINICKNTFDAILEVIEISINTKKRNLTAGAINKTPDNIMKDAMVIYWLEGCIKDLKDLVEK